MWKVNITDKIEGSPLIAFSCLGGIYILTLVWSITTELEKSVNKTEKAISRAVLEPSYAAIKLEKLAEVTAIFSTQDVFAVLPISFGKNSFPSVISVVTPHTSNEAL